MLKLCRNQKRRNPYELDYDVQVTECKAVYLQICVAQTHRHFLPSRRNLNRLLDTSLGENYIGYVSCISPQTFAFYSLYSQFSTYSAFRIYAAKSKPTRGKRHLVGSLLQLFKFIADSGDTLDIVWKIRFKAQFLTQLTYMIMNRFFRIEITILFPNQICNHFISKNTFGIGNEQCQYIKLLTCQVDNPFPNPDSAVFQTQIKLAFLYFCKRILLCCGESVTGIEYCSMTDSLFQNILHQSSLLFLVKKQK